MQFTLLIITAFAAFTSAVDVRGYTDYNCAGQQWICPNVASGTCCKFPVNVRSMFWGLPLIAGGIGYNGLVCTGVQYTAVSGSTNSCWNYGALPYPVCSGKWVAGLFSRRVARGESELEARDSEDNCIPASVFVFTHNGTTTVLNVPEGSVKQVVDLAAKGDYEGLKTLGKDWISISEDFGFDGPPTEIHNSTLAVGR